MGALKLKVKIRSATQVGGTLPFVVVSIDNNPDIEIHKTEVADGGTVAVWDEEFEFNLTPHIRALVERGNPEPRYLTFSVFDFGERGTPALGVARVPLVRVRDGAGANGQFRIWHGDGTLSLSVARARREWLQSDAARMGAAVGAAALATGVSSATLRAATKGKKKKRSKGVAVGVSMTMLVAGLTFVAVSSRRRKMVVDRFPQVGGYTSLYNGLKSFRNSSSSRSNFLRSPFWS